MREILKSIFVVMAAMVTSLGFVACNDDDDKNVSLAGKWLLMSEEYKELLIINADNTLLSTGADDEDAWLGVEGRIELDGDNFTYISEDGDNSFGTYRLTNSQLTLIIDGEEYVYNKLIEEFTMTGSWECENTVTFIKAVKDELTLPVGSIVNGEEIPISVQTANIKGEFIEEAVNAYFRDVEFKDNGEMTYKVLIDDVETPTTKNYELSGNLLKITGKVGSTDIENQFMVFQSIDHSQSFLFLTKNNVADMFYTYALMLREGGVSEGTTESLEGFRNEFMEVFENFAVIVYLQRE